MKRLLTMLMIIALMIAALPALADTDGYPDNILLDTGVPYGNYGYPGLVKLHDGDMDKVVAHMRSARANQQGGGIGSRKVAAIVASAASGDLLDQLLAMIQNSEYDDDPIEALLSLIAYYEGEGIRDALNQDLINFLDGDNVSNLDEDDIWDFIESHY